MTMVLNPYTFGGGGGGGGSGLVALTDHSLTVSGYGSQTISYLVSNTGVVQRGRNGIYHTLETWKLSGAAADYDVRVTETGGVGLSSGSATATWLNLGTTREWGLSEGTSGFASDTYFTAEIRLAASPFTVLASANIVLFAISF